jgi:hypothetical protein
MTLPSHGLKVVIWCAVGVRRMITGPAFFEETNSYNLISYIIILGINSRCWKEGESTLIWRTEGQDSMTNNNSIQELVEIACQKKKHFQKIRACLVAGYQSFETLLSNMANWIKGGKTDSKFPAYACLVCYRGPAKATVLKEQQWRTALRAWGANQDKYIRRATVQITPTCFIKYT